MVVRTIVILFIMVMLAGCNDVVESGYVPDVIDARKWFDKNKEIVIEIKDKLRNYKNIREISTTYDYNFADKYGDLSEEEKSYYNEVVTLGKKHGFFTIIASRDEDEFSIRFIVFNTKDGSICIEYILGYEKFKNKLIKDNALFPLNETDWYVAKFHL